MGYRAGDSYCCLFVSWLSDGSAGNADFLPVATANHNGIDDATFVLTVTNIDAGRYKITGTIPGTYVGGDVINTTVVSTVQGILSKSIPDTQVIDRLPPHIAVFWS